MSQDEQKGLSWEEICVARALRTQPRLLNYEMIAKILSDYVNELPVTPTTVSKCVRPKKPAKFRAGLIEDWIKEDSHINMRATLHNEDGVWYMNARDFGKALDNDLDPFCAPTMTKTLHAKRFKTGFRSKYFRQFYVKPEARLHRREFRWVARLFPRMKNEIMLALRVKRQQSELKSMTIEVKQSPLRSD